MKRLEIIVNQSIEDEVVSILESLHYGEAFTHFAPVFGRGNSGRREGTGVWPERNSLYLIFIKDQEAELFLNEIRRIKEEFPDEGIRCVVSGGVEESL